VTFGICTPQPCCSRVSRCMSSLPGWALGPLITLRAYAHVIRSAKAAPSMIGRGALPGSRPSWEPPIVSPIGIEPMT
jgi:hypothetical protein